MKSYSKNNPKLECFMKLKSTFAPLKHGNMEIKMNDKEFMFLAQHYGLPIATN